MFAYDFSFMFGLTVDKTCSIPGHKVMTTVCNRIRKWPSLGKPVSGPRLAEPTRGVGRCTRTQRVSLAATPAIIFSSDCSIRWRSKVSLVDYCVYLRVAWLCLCGGAVCVRASGSGPPSARPHASPTHVAGAPHSRPAASPALSQSGLVAN